MKKKIKTPDLICTCGHLDTDHNLDNPWHGFCRFDDGDLGKRCTCIEFRLDNLLYLEELERAR